MLLEVGLDSGHLRCPVDWPGSGEAEVLWRERGRKEPERVFHNCSGKHAGMLRACVARGWSLEYTDPGHPLQVEMVAAVEQATGRSATPVGVDGCSAPTMRSDTVGLARAFAYSATAAEMAEVRAATLRYAALTRGGDQPEAQVARWLPTVVKGGAAGCIGIGWPEGGIGVAAKSWSGESSAALVGALMVMEELGLVPAHPRRMLADQFAPPVLGGGAPVGRWEVISR
jgi:L-asparaginase II